MSNRNYSPPKPKWNCAIARSLNFWERFRRGPLSGWRTITLPPRHCPREINKFHTFQNSGKHTLPEDIKPHGVRTYFLQLDTTIQHTRYTSDTLNPSLTMKASRSHRCRLDSMLTCEICSSLLLQLLSHSFLPQLLRARQLTSPYVHVAFRYHHPVSLTRKPPG